MNIDQPTTVIEERALKHEAVRSGRNLLDYILIIARHKKTVLLPTFAAALLAVAYSLSLPNIYTAKAMILPGEDDKGIMGAMVAQMGGLAGFAGDALGGKTKADLYVTMLRSETIKDKIIDRFDLMKVYEAEYRASAYMALDRRIMIAAGKKDGVITIAVDDKDPKRAANIANEYVAELGKFAVRLAAIGAGNNKTFLEQRIAETRADLGKAEEALKDFQAKNKAIAVTDQARATIEGVAQMRAQLAGQEIQLGTLKQQFADSSHEVKAARATIANLRAQIAGLEGKGEGAGSSSIPTVGTVPKLGQEYLRLMREFKIHEAVLEMLAKQYEVTSLSEAKDFSPLQVIQVAKAPEKKSRPARSKIVIAITGAVFCGSVFFVLLRERFRALSASDVEKCLEIMSHLGVRRFFRC